MNRKKSFLSRFMFFSLVWTVLFLGILAGNALAVTVTVLGQNNDGTIPAELINYR